LNGVVVAVVVVVVDVVVGSSKGMELMDENSIGERDDDNELDEYFS